MSVEIVMTRDAYDCLEPLLSDELTERMEAPTYLHGSATTPPQVVVSCSLAVADALLKLARPTCRAAADAIRIAIAADRKSRGGA